MTGLVDAFLADETPAYIRVGRGAVPVLYPEGVKVEIGKAIKWGDGKDVGIIACGQMVSRALDAQKLLEEQGIHATVLDMHTIKPLDEQAVIDLARECGCSLTVEEHSLYGGLGGAVAEVVTAHDPVPVAIAAIPDEDVPNGEDSQVFEYLKLDGPGLCERAKELMKRKQ